MICHICSSATALRFTAVVLKKYSVSYYQCTSCGFIQTEDPFWLAESYASAINDVDLGPVNRAMRDGRFVELILMSFFDSEKRIVDYGGGYGILTRLLRDRGFDCYWFDKYCENIFTKHFVARPDSGFEVLTAFEVFEHLHRPLDEISQMLTFAPAILFSTQLVPPSFRTPNDWWYIAPEHGQHIAFYTATSLQRIADRFNLSFVTDGRELHMLSQKPVSPYLFRFLAKDNEVKTLLRYALRMRKKKKSLLIDDFTRISGYSLWRSEERL